MAMLKFKKGLWSKLPETKVEGTIYVTTDEKAMYVDISGSERIRLGDIIRVNTFNELQPPFSNEAFYYVEASNALLKRVAVTGENSEVTYEWKQINSTQELTNRLTVVENQVATNKSDIGTLKTDVGTLKTDVGTLKTTVGTHGTDIEALKAAVGMTGDGEVEGLAGTVANIRKDLTTLGTEVHGTDGNGGMKATLSEHAGKISALETASATHALKTDVSAAKTAILGQTEGGADFNGTVKGAYDNAAAAKTQADKGVTDAAAAQSKANANEQAISGLTNRVSALDNATTGEVPLLKARVQNLENAGYATVSQVTEAKNEVLGTASDDAGAATVHGALKSAAAAKAAADAADSKAAAAQGDINTWKTDHANDYTNSQIDTAVADAKKAGTDAQTALNTYKDAHASDYTNKQIDDKVKAVQDKVDEHTNTLSNLTGNGTGSVAEAKAAADAAQRDATQALSDAAAAKTQADKGVSDAAAAKSAADAAQATADANASEIATLKGAVGTAKKGTGDGTEGNDAATGLYKVIEDNNTALEAKLSAEIDADIRAANAMEYAGTIESASGIPTSGVKNGATYVIGTSFGSYAAGDMLIAQGTENPDTGLIANPTWAHVKSGYDASLDQQLTGANNKIMLSNGVRNDEDAAGAITFAATGSASVAVANNTVTIGMVWEDFN